ncbi:ATP-grasp domain-containing protein [Acuticoccus sp. MNP-M23]|uniref:ATP-grasp domain-containing protein n=1 Tax=Acuticoccus sp. MNP-M23 TaxID=3072793 RepID=UPI0028150CAC|nr:ATP-grasp domain-containing protein [Acuticoccus sp. MNP-M23]WMS41862.1 ATP-grasp domain-containing protein [Acuticoccus sp. MNP-M23]
MTKNVFVIGMNDLNHERLKRLKGVEDVVFHGVIDPAIVYEVEDYNIPSLLEIAERQIRAADVPVDAIIGYMDIPVSTMLPLLAKKFGTRATSLESLLKCEHKFWSRTVQREVIPEHIPAFTAFDPFDDDALSKIGQSALSFPFFVKPIKSSGSRLGFRVDNPEDFDFAIEKLRAGVGAVSEPFDYVLDHAEMPADIRKVAGQYCMAEQIIGGRQCTLEGYVYDGKVVPYGVVDSIRYPQVLSFFYYMYPSKLPQRVQDRMAEIAIKIMEHTGYDDSAFNIEFFWDEVQDKIWLLEINTRLAQSHCDMFEKVDGTSHQQVAVDIGLGRAPQMPKREGGYNVAAEFFYRVFFNNAVASSVPSAEEVAAAQDKVPGTTVAVQMKEGMRLTELPEQDSYSFAVCCIWMGANTQASLLWNYERVMKGLNFEFTNIDE